MADRPEKPPLNSKVDLDGVLEELLVEERQELLVVLVVTRKRERLEVRWQLHYSMLQEAVMMKSQVWAVMVVKPMADVSLDVAI